LRLGEIDHTDLLRHEGVDRLDEICREWGIFVLRNHPIARADCEAMLGQMAGFFARPLEEKRRCERSDANPWGYYDRELTKNIRDWKEIFDFGPVAGGSIPRWPEGDVEFRSVAEDFYGACERIALDIVRALALALGTEVEGMLRAFDHHTSYLRMNAYPLCEAPSPAETPTGPPQGHFAISHHSDAGAVTVLLHDGNDGFQVEKGGRWHDISVERGSLVINLGDVMQVWSNDRYRAPLHRVLASRSRVRLSAPFFLNPGFETDYAPLVPLGEGEAPRYRSINWGEFRAARAAGDYANVGQEVQIEDFRLPAENQER